MKTIHANQPVWESADLKGSDVTSVLEEFPGSADDSIQPMYVTSFA